MSSNSAAVSSASSPRMQPVSPNEEKAAIRQARIELACSLALAALGAVALALTVAGFFGHGPLQGLSMPYEVVVGITSSVGTVLYTASAWKRSRALNQNRTMVQSIASLKNQNLEDLQKRGFTVEHLPV